MHGLSSYINKVYHGFSQGAPKATPQIVYSFDTFVMTVKVFAAMTGENAELFTVSQVHLFVWVFVHSASWLYREGRGGEQRGTRVIFIVVLCCIQLTVPYNVVN